MKKFLKSYNAFTILFAILLIVTVVCTPIFGLGDLSEYISVFESVGLYNISADTFCISQSYGISSPEDGSKSVFEMFLITLISINKLFSSEVFNIHLLSLVYCIAFLIGMYFLQKNICMKKDYLNYAFSALLGLVFLDLGYIAYFNSFYTEAMIFVLIVVIASLMMSLARRFSFVKLLVISLIVCIFACMKFTTAVVSVAAGVILFVISMSLRKNERLISAVAATIIILASIVSMFNAYIPAREVKIYSHIYSDLAIADPAVLNKFGLPECEYDGNITIDEMKQLVSGVTYADIAGHYISNPKLFFEKIKSAVNNSYFLILDFAEYREAGANYGIRDGLCLRVWNTLKKRVVPQGIWVVLMFIIAYIVVSIREYIKYRKENNSVCSNIALFAILLPIGSIAELVGTVITTGKILISKNMFVFGVYFDMMLITAVIWVAAILIARQEAIKSKYGVNQ